MIDIEGKARELYEEYSNNHPTIHSNLFCTWKELNEHGKENWRDEARKHFIHEQHAVVKISDEAKKLSTEAENLLYHIDNDSDEVLTNITAYSIDLISKWTVQAFGPGQRTEGILDHIRKELKEVEKSPLDLEEWIDIMLLALNGAQRLGYSGERIIEAFYTKVRKNANREWPDWRKSNPNKAIEHIKE